jgi:hypothetical protein
LIFWSFPWFGTNVRGSFPLKALQKGNLSDKAIEFQRQVDTVFNAKRDIENIQKKGEEVGFERGKTVTKIHGLLDNFRDFGQISPSALQRIKESKQLLPENLLKEIGKNYVANGDITQEQLQNFIELLSAAGILSK